MVARRTDNSETILKKSTRERETQMRDRQCVRENEGGGETEERNEEQEGEM